MTVAGGTWAKAAAVVALLLAQLGCASATYEPRPSPRIARVHAYRPFFVRDGVRHEVGLLGGGAEALVAGNEQAVAHARTHRRKSIVGFTFLGVFAGTYAAGTYLTLEGDDHDKLGSVLFFSSLAPLLMSSVFVASARGDLENAVNIYNDSLEGPIAPKAFDFPPPPPDGR